MTTSNKEHSAEIIIWSAMKQLILKLLSTHPEVFSEKKEYYVFEETDFSIMIDEEMVNWIRDSCWEDR